MEQFIRESDARSLRHCTDAVGIVYDVGMETETFGQRVRKARDYRVMSQSELALQADLNRVHVAAIESGRAGKRPYPKTIRSLAAALNVDPHWLRDGAGTMECD